MRNLILCTLSTLALLSLSAQNSFSISLYANGAVDEQAVTSVAAPSPDFDGDGVVGIPDFLLFVNHFGSSRGDGTYDAKYDLDGNGVIGIPDFLLFVDNFGKDVSSPTVDIPDANLRAAIEDSLGKASGAPITRAEMATLTSLEVPNKNISDLTGLEFATGLTRLDLGEEVVNGVGNNSNEISNISSLSGLTNLTYLNLRRNVISDVSALSNLTNLTYLNLSFNEISDISALSNLTNLTYLSFSFNKISDVSVVSNLTNLTELAFGSNMISDSDVSVVSNLTNLTTLWLYENNISDISPLSGLTNLDSLHLYDNDISDIAPLVANMGLSAGDYINVRGNPLSDTSLDTHIPTLQGREIAIFLIQCEQATVHC